MKIVVSGGTGFIGSAIVRELLRQKTFEVTVMSRNSTKIKELFGDHVHARPGDVTRPETLETALQGHEAVIQCIQFPNHPVQNPRLGYTYEKVDAEGTENLCEAIKKTKINRVVYISGAGTDPHRPEPWFRAKVRAEAAVKNLGRDFVILRPSWVYGPGDRSLNRFVQFAKILPFVPVIGNGLSRVSPLFIEDLARVCVKALTYSTAKNKIIDIGGPHIMTMNEVQQTVLDVLGKRKPLFHQPVGLMKIVGSVAEFLPKPPLSREAIAFITMDIPVDCKTAEKIFDMRFTSLRDALMGYLK